MVEKNHRLHEINTEAEGKIMKLKNKKNENENKESCEINPFRVCGTWAEPTMCNLVVRKRKMLKDERGQLSIDFLVGISLFILALLFMAHFIPGMFVPFQSETIDLSSVAYRTSVILVEDPGWWNGTGAGADYGTDWDTEAHIDSVSRVGLAIDKEHPNVLSKIDGFKNCSDTNLSDKLGLYRMIGGNPIYYGYNITIVNASGNILAAKGEIPPKYGDVVKIKRIVSVLDSERGAIDATNLSGSSNPVKALLVIDSADVSTFCDDAVNPIKISITNFTFPTPPGPPGSFVHLKVVQTNISDEPGAKLHVGGGEGNGLHIKTGTTLSSESDGYWQVNEDPTGKFGELPADINSATDILTIAINKRGFVDAGINTSGSDPGDIVIEIKLNQIDCKKETDPANLLRYSTTDKIVHKPRTLIVKVWT